MNLKVIGWAALALLVVFGAGWGLGTSGRSALILDQRSAEERALVAEARSAALEGRVSLFLVNFGDASARFEQAHGIVEQLQVRWREAGQAERAGRLQIALAHLRDAQRQAAALDQSAQASAVEAIKALDGAR